MKKLPRENAYACQFGCLTITVDVDEGVTPFMIECRSKSTKDRPIPKDKLNKNGECIGTATSSMYPRKPRPHNIPPPTHEWYKPDILEGLSEGELEHVKKGGLLLRERTEKEPIYHEPT